MTEGQQRGVKRPSRAKNCEECRRRKCRCDRLTPCNQCQKPAPRECHYAADRDAGYSDGSDDEMVIRTPNKVLGNPSIPQRPNMEDLSTRLERLERTVAEEIMRLRASQRPPDSSLTFIQARAFLLSHGRDSHAARAFWHCQEIYRAIQERHKRITAPIAVYVDFSTPIQRRMADVLPTKEICDRHVLTYLEGFDMLYRVLHIPSFMDQYARFWRGEKQSKFFLPQLLAVMCLGYRIRGAGKGQFPNDGEGVHLRTACHLVRGWLDSLQGQQPPNLSSLQTEVLLVMAQRTLTTHYQESWRQLGYIVRMAMTMGMHQDPSEYPYQIAPFWAEQRRKLWAAIVELDIHFSTQLNPCPAALELMSSHAGHRET
ncbi:hypothetical protein F5Y17DRAFT_229560 [Xylariaceae sp. FL0594]|nr:hypothetical protein F5Y17DRAFT_229560 [Xylariaceae sp. FL0594]